MKVSFFETARYRAPEALPPEWPVPSGAYDREAGAQAYRGMIERLRVRRGARLRLGQRLRAPLLAAHPDAVPDRLGGVHRRPPEADQDRPARPDRPAQQSGARGRGAGDARHPGAGPPGRRAAAGDDERGPDLRPQPAGGARAHRRGHGADPQGVDGAAAVRLAGPPLPVPDRLDLAAPAAAAPSADLRAGDEPRVVRVRRAPPPRAAACPTGRSRSWPRPRGTTASSARATAGSRRPEQIIYRANMLVAETDEEAQALLRAQPKQAPFAMRAGVRDAS